MDLVTRATEATADVGDRHGLSGIGPAFSWASISLAVFTAVLQGLVTALTFMTEASAHWTFRFRLATAEHLWWTFVSVLLLASLVMSAIAFTSGEGGDPVSVLALSSATFLALVRYSVPAWQQRAYTWTRWYAWTGDSRTAIKREYLKFCGDSSAWNRLVQNHRHPLRRLQPTPSDYYGWRIWPAPGLRVDPTDVFRVLRADEVPSTDAEKATPAVGVYSGPDPTSATVSLRWGERQGFGRRISRAVSSMPLCLLRSNPTTIDGYDGKGITTAMGILGRNKGLQPWKLVFKASSDVTSHMENASTWTPRPAKVLRSFYRYTLHTQYQGLGEDYVNAAVELALLLVDVPSWVIDEWLMLGLEHQCLETNAFLSETVLAQSSEDERRDTLAAQYESSYAAMILSLNAMRVISKDQRGKLSTADICRPELLCTGLLMKARGLQEPTWWNRPDVQDLRQRQNMALSEEIDWKLPAAKLLGLDAWPIGFDAVPSMWE